MVMFRSRFIGQLVILTLLVATAEAHASNKPSEAELAAITARGVLLAEYDTAAWQATDAVQAAHPVEGRVGRYIARKTDAGWVVGRVARTPEDEMNQGAPPVEFTGGSCFSFPSTGNN
jgi:hypothetical protein